MYRFSDFLITTCCLFLSLLFSSCRKEAPPEPPGYQPSIFLEALDASCTEAWLRVRFAEDVQQRAWSLVRDGQTVLSAQSSPLDTVVVDEGPLLPNHTYTYKTYQLADSGLIDSSTQVTLTTFDTTSHAFSFQIDTLGNGDSSVLSDVAIINDTLMYAVGEMYLQDSTGQINPFSYSLAIWDGTRWMLKRLYYGGTNLIVSIRGIFAPSTNDVWLAAGSVFHWDGVSSQAQLSLSRLSLPDPSATVEKLWGTDGSNLYGVGNAGTIVQYTNGTWQRQESGTTLTLTDVWGVSASEVYAVGLHYGQGRGVVLRGDGQTWQTLIEGFPTTQVDSSQLFRTKFYGTTKGVWVDERQTLYTVGNLMYRNRRGRWDYVRSLPGNCPGCNPNFLYTGYLHAVRGNALNNMLICGEVNTLKHFNGVTWAEVGLPYYPLRPEIFWYKCAVRNHVAVAVGKISMNCNRGIVIRMWR